MHPSGCGVREHCGSDRKEIFDVRKLKKWLSGVFFVAFGYGWIGELQRVGGELLLHV